MLAVIWGYFDQSVTSPISILHIADMEAVVADAWSSNTSVTVASMPWTLFTAIFLALARET